jgi:predicted metal-dependent HD superfamily phosphohydrolase
VNLSARWSALWHKLNLPAPAPQVLGNLCDRYTEPHRAYHTLQHLGECLAWVDRADNETRSADLAVQVIKGVGGEYSLQRSVHAMILATRHETVSNTLDSRLVVNIDLAILGAAADRFAQYETQIRQEYAWVPEPLFCQRRAEILQGWLNRPAIFTVDCFREKLEHQAQENLRRSLAMLKQGPI